MEVYWIIIFDISGVDRQGEIYQMGKKCKWSLCFWMDIKYLFAPKVRENGKFDTYSLPEYI